MKITTVSNYINHHQIPLSNALYQVLGEEYHFIQTEPMEEERIKMGWGQLVKDCPYLCCFYEQAEACRRLILDSDIVIFGGVEDESYIEERLALGKIVIRSSERIYKAGQWRAVSPRGLKKKYHDHMRYRKAPVYLLCNGGYVASDFHIIRAYPNKMFRWGYFPQTYHYQIAQLMAAKPQDIMEIVWVGRFIHVKQPEYVLRLARQLARDQIRAHITIIGGGELKEKISNCIEKERLQDVITMTGFKNPTEVRSYMERSNISIATSQYWEGWGAVINEAMNSGCAVVASHAMGATPYLIQDGVNGLIYRNEDFHEFYACVKKLILDRDLRQRLGRAAYETITTVWNAENAAQQLLKLCTQLCDGVEDYYAPEGPISKAPIVAPGRMYHYLKTHAKKQ
ncbi:MAG: glycosyltransferase [Lachnospiraceae bacterium]